MQSELASFWLENGILSRALKPLLDLADDIPEKSELKGVKDVEGPLNKGIWGESDTLLIVRYIGLPVLSDPTI